MRWLALLATLFALPAAAAPQRVVSINLCADELALMLMPGPRLASVTAMARDPAETALSALAQAKTPNSGGIEEVLRLAPDLVLATRWSNPFTLRALNDRSIPVHLVDEARTLNDMRRNIAALATVLEVNADALLADFDARLARLQGVARGRIVILGDGFMTLGPGHVLDALVRHMGLVNIAGEAGIPAWGRLDMETLLTARPDMLLLGSYRPAAPALQHVSLRHPALARVVAHERITRVESKLWSCGTPVILEVAEALARRGPRAIRAAVR